MNPHFKPGPLWLATRDLHHACEVHPVGGVMAIGKPPSIWYSHWLRALRQLHYEVDSALPEELGRVDRLTADLNVLALRTKDINAASVYALTLTTPDAIDGAAYVLTGAHLMGGEIMRRRLTDYPTKHLEWDDRKVGLAWLKVIRERGELSQHARNCFSALLAIMDEIVLKYPQTELAV